MKPIVLFVGLLFCALVRVSAIGDEFVMNVLPREISLNPLESYTSTEAQLFTALYEGLVSYHPRTLRPVPAVAERWEIGRDGREYRFHLRDDARYSNGDRVIAEHFRDTWLTLIDPAAESPYSFLFDLIEGGRDYRMGITTNAKGVGIIAASDDLLVVRLTEPAPHFLSVLCHHSFVTLHPDLLRRPDWDRYDESGIVGNGPYAITEFTPRRLSMERSSFYWDRDTVAIPKLVIQFDDDTDRTTEDFNLGILDWVASGISLDGVVEREAIVVNTTFATTYFFFASREAPWSDGRVRRALALLLPWDEIRSRDFHINPTHTLVPSIPQYPDIEGIQQSDSQEALRLLEEAGYPRGVGLGEVVIKIPEGEENERIAGLMSTHWRRHLFGSPRVEIVRDGDYFEALKRRDYTIGTLSWIGDFADPLTFLQLWITDSNLNDAGFSNPDYDGLIERSMGERGRDRYQTLGDAERLLLESGVVLPVSHFPAVNLIRVDSVGGWFANPLDIHPFKHLRFVPPPPNPNIIRRDRIELDVRPVPTGF